MILRPFQSDAIDGLRAGIRAGYRRIVLVQPTGSGKTVTAASMIQSAIAKSTRVVFLAHRKELIDQASSKLDAFGVPHGVIMANHPRSRPWESVQVASIQTISRRGLPWQPSLIVADECHRIKGNQYMEFLGQFPNAVTIGLTATPCRADGKGLRPPFDYMVLGPSIPTLIGMQYLVPVKAFSKKSPDLNGVHSSGGDYKINELSAKMNRSEITGDVVSEWFKRANGRQTVVFGVDVQHSKDLRDAFLNAGVIAEHVDGTTPKAEREAILARLASGETTVVTNCGVISEGWDCPVVSCVSIVRPTMSLSLFLQMAGRAMRPADGKSDCIVLDHGGCIRRPGFGHPSSEREWTLDGEMKRATGKKIRDIDDIVKVCPECDFVNAENATKCSECGYTFFRKERKITHVKGDLELVSESEQPVPEKIRKERYFLFMFQQHTMTKRNGDSYSAGYAFAKYMAEYSARPKRGWRKEWTDSHPELVAEDKRRRAEMAEKSQLAEREFMLVS